MERAEKDGVYSIGAVVKMLGVPAQTLRSWEDRYHQIVPARSAGGQRLYSRDQVDQLHFILGELDRGMQPADAHRLLKERNRFPIEPRAGADEVTTILLAERDPFSAELSEYLLRTEGYTTRIALDAEYGSSNARAGRSEPRGDRSSHLRRSWTGALPTGATSERSRSLPCRRSTRETRRSGRAPTPSC